MPSLFQDVIVAPTAGEDVAVEARVRQGTPAVVQAVRPPRLTLSLWRSEPAELLASGTGLDVLYADEKGVVAVRTRAVKVEGSLLTVEVLQVRRHQRRRYYRWSVSLPVRFVARKGDRLYAWDWDDAADEPWRAARTADISAGGARIYAPSPPQAGDLVWVEVQVDGAAARMQGRVVRVEPAATGGAMVSVEFTRAVRGSEERIVRFIFSQERLARKRGLL